mgnify:CR=1 FL=1
MDVVTNFIYSVFIRKCLLGKLSYLIIKGIFFPLYLLVSAIVTTWSFWIVKGNVTILLHVILAILCQCIT